MYEQKNLINFKKIENAIQQTEENLKSALEELPELKMRLSKRMAFAALGEDNHVQIARIKRKISEIEDTIMHAPSILQELKQIRVKRQV
jgi:recombinational DNA repair protein RecR